MLISRKSRLHCLYLGFWQSVSGINPARFYFPEVEKTALSCYNQHKSEENSEKVENFAKRVEYNDCFTA